MVQVGRHLFFQSGDALASGHILLFEQGNGVVQALVGILQFGQFLQDVRQPGGLQLVEESFRPVLGNFDVAAGFGLRLYSLGIGFNGDVAHHVVGIFTLEMLFGFDQVDGKDFHRLDGSQGKHHAIDADQPGGDAVVRHLAAADDAVAVLGKEFVRHAEPFAL